MVTAQQNGNWTGDAKFKMTFKNGGAVDFGQAIVQLTSFGKLRFYVCEEHWMILCLAKRHQPSGPPPPYMEPNEPSFPAPPPAYSPDPNGYYGWQPPTHVFPSAPPPNTIQMVNAPPPYPGIYGMQASQNPYQGASCPPQGILATRW